MGSWVLLLLAQAGLVAVNRRALHQNLGVASIVLMPAIVITGMLLVLGTFRAVWGLDPALVPGDVMADLKSRLANIAAVGEAEHGDAQHPYRGYYESWLVSLERLLERNRLLED